MYIEYLWKMIGFAFGLYYTMDYIFISEIDNMVGFLSLFAVIIITCLIFAISHREKILNCEQTD